MGEEYTFSVIDGPHSLKPERGEKEQKEPWNATLCLAPIPGHPCSLHIRVHIYSSGCVSVVTHASQWLGTRPAGYMKCWNRQQGNLNCVGRQHL